MLTKSDLQQIRTIVQEEVKEQIDPVKTDVSSLKKDAKHIKNKLNKVSKDVDTLIPYFDERITDLENDVKALKNN